MGCINIGGGFYSQQPPVALQQLTVAGKSGKAVGCNDEQQQNTHTRMSTHEHTITRTRFEAQADTLCCGFEMIAYSLHWISTIALLNSLGHGEENGVKGQSTRTGAGQARLLTCTHAWTLFYFILFFLFARCCILCSLGTRIHLHISIVRVKSSCECL